MVALAIWLVTALGVAASIGAPIRERPQDTRALAAPLVYAAMLADSRCSGVGTAGARGPDLVVVREAVVPMRQWWWDAFPHSDFPKQIPTWLPGIRSETLQSFLELTAPNSLLDSSVGSVAVAWINRTDIEQLGSRGGFWQEFYRRHSSATGYIELSSLGWSSDAREALGYCGRTSESLSGSGFLVLLRYAGERWMPVRWRQVWQS
jgi:hypothetical protein